MIAIGAFGLTVAGGVSYYFLTQDEAAPVVTAAPVTRGDVIETVDATGTLQAVTTVQVGTQVSGTIKALHVDFNARVRRGQVIAELEPSLFEAQVEQSRASVVRLEADALRADVQRDDAQRKLARAQALFAAELISRSDFETAEVTARQAEAAVKSAAAQITQARASLNQSEVNLGHTVIRAPIDGIVISRNVDVGQTVAASMQAPTLFVLARDLGEMQVNASVAESDIGRIAPRQSVSFRVDAYPDRVFSGRVAQVRLEPVVQQNVVSYVTTIDVPNPDLALKPGMTANVTVEIARAEGVLRIPNGALRVRPSAEVLAALERTGEPRLSSIGRADVGEDNQGRPAQVWVSTDGGIERVPVLVSITDGSYTALVGGSLSEGSLVVTGIVASSKGALAASGSPLLPFGARIPGGGRGGGQTRPPNK